MDIPNIRETTILPFSAIFKHCRLSSLIKNKSPADSLGIIQNLVWKNVLFFAHVWTIAANKVTLKFTVKLARNTEQAQEDDVDESDRNLSYQTISIVFNNTKFNATVAREPGTQAPTYVRSGRNNVLYIKRNWSNISEIAKMIIKFKGPLELHLKTNATSQIIPILRGIEKPYQFRMLEMGYNDMTDYHANHILSACGSVETMMFENFDETFTAISSIPAYTVLFNNCPELRMRDLLRFNNPRLELINPVNITNQDICNFVTKWVLTESLAFEKLRLEYVNMENPFDINELLSLYPDYFLAFDEQRRDWQLDFIDTDRCHDYMNLFDLPNSIDVFRTTDSTIGTLAVANNSLYFVVWHHTQ